VVLLILTNALPRTLIQGTEGRDQHSRTLTLSHFPLYPRRGKPINCLNEDVPSISAAGSVADGADNSWSGSGSVSSFTADNSWSSSLEDVVSRDVVPVRDVVSGDSGELAASLGLAVVVVAVVVVVVEGAPCGTAPCGAALCGTAPCGAALCGTAPCGAALCGTAPCGAALCGAALCGTAPCGAAPCGAATAESCASRESSFMPRPVCLIACRSLEMTAKENCLRSEFGLGGYGGM